MLLKILREHKPDYLAVVFDEKGPTVRHGEFKAYKAQRPEMPQGMQAQIPYIHRAVEAFGLPVIRLEGHEADDLIGTLARKAEAKGLDVVIVTADKDMFQLLTAAVRIYDPVKDKWFGEQECRERFGVEPARVVEIMGLMGDATDNIPGVKGIGEKTAVKLIAEFGTIEELLRRADQLPSAKTRALLVGQADNARLSRQLATIHLDCPVEFEADRFRVRPPGTEALVAFLREMEFPTLLKTVQPEAGSPVWGREVEILSDEGAAKRFAEQAMRAGLVGIHCLIEDPGARPAGMALSIPEGPTVFLPVVEEQTLCWPKPILNLLQQPACVKAIHDLKPALLACERAGLKLEPPWFDTMIAAYLLNPNRRTHTLEAVALDALGYHLGPQEAQGPIEPGTQQLLPGTEAPPAARPPAPAVLKAAEMAVVVGRLVAVLTERMKEQGSFRLFQEVEMPLVPVLADIERNGFGIDVAALESLGKEIEREIDRLTETITRLAGETFNFNSPRQLATVLFDKLGLKPIRKTKTGYSTDEETLTQLATQHELPAQILNCRNLSKLKSTYVDALPGLVNPRTGRLHTSLHQTVTATGRLSSSEPNLQNIPVKGEFGLRIREAFVAAPGCLLLSADYSQIEPRILAHLSRDPRLLEVFERGEDIHTATAMEIFNLAADQITRDMRRIAKTVVFGIAYGISPFGLASTLGVSQHEAKIYIETYFARYAGVKAFLDRTIEEAKRSGYVTTILGRRRPIPELASPDATQRSFGERMAVNNPIQGSAADLIKMAMIGISRRLAAEMPQTKMILQVHDELIFEVPEKDLEPAKTLVRSEMEATGQRLGLTVPLKVDLGVGRNWRQAHP
jgi:DNA polymerase-1